MARRIGILLSLWLVGGGGVLALPQGEQPRARITGRVLSTEGKPLARARIIFTKQAGSVETQAKTDRTGYYTVEVDPGTYLVRAEKEGYVTTFYTVEGTSAAPTPVTVEAGKSTTLTLRLSRGGVITGRIVDEDGEPLVGARVIAERKRDEERGTDFAVGMATSDDRGIYRIYGLRSGRYYVSAQIVEMRVVSIAPGQRGIAPEEGSVTYYPGVSSRQQAVEVEVVEGAETSGIDFKIVPGERVLIFGTVRRREDGQPITGISVLAYPLGDSPVRPPTVTRAMTDEHGRYEIKGISPGTYRVQAQVSINPMTGEEYANPSPQEVTVENEPVEVNFELERGAEISGRILTEDGRVPEQVTQMIPLLRIKGTDSFLGAMSLHRVDAQGNFTLKRVPSGTFLFDLPARDSPYFLRAVLHKGRDITREGLLVHPGERVTEIVLVVSDAGATVRGRVLARDGEGAIPGAVIQLVPVDFARHVAEQGTFTVRATVSDQRGGYEIRAVPPGRYYLVVFPKRPTFRRREEMLDFLTARAAQLPVIEVKSREVKQLDVRPTVPE